MVHVCVPWHPLLLPPCHRYEREPCLRTALSPPTRCASRLLLTVCLSLLPWLLPVAIQTTLVYCYMAESMQSCQLLSDTLCLLFLFLLHSLDSQSCYLLAHLHAPDYVFKVGKVNPYYPVVWQGHQLLIDDSRIHWPNLRGGERKVDYCLGLACRWPCWSFQFVVAYQSIWLKNPIEVCCVSLFRAVYVLPGAVAIEIS